MTGQQGMGDEVCGRPGLIYTRDAGHYREAETSAFVQKFSLQIFPNISTHDLHLVDTTDTKNHCLRNFRQQKYTHDLYLMDTTDIIVKQTLQFLSDPSPDPDPDMSPIYESGCMSL